MQKFKKGDWVQIAKDLGPFMSHFTADCEAIVIGSYEDQCGGGNDTKDYTLYRKGHGQISWYKEYQLTLIEPDRLDKLKEWEDATAVERKEKSDIDWIFSHGKEVLEKTHGASIATLAECFGFTNLSGSHGERSMYYQNAMIILRLAKPFLETGDKLGWIARCEEIR